MSVRSLFGFGNDVFLAEKLKDLQEKWLRLTSRAEDIRTEVRNEEMQARKKQKSEVSRWLEEVDKMKKELQSIEKRGLWHSGVREKVERMVETVDNLIKQSDFPRGLLLDDFNPKGLELVTEKLGGSTTSDVWSCFKRGEVRVGLYGMGGMGKTSVAMHINNKILREKDSIFHHVFYVTVSRDTSVYKLQNNVAQAFGLHKLKFEDELKRAAELKQALTKRKRSLLILDDVWKNISMATVGVCVEGDGCKLLITTRRKEVCNKMSCCPVKINPLSDEESWELFKKQLGNYEELPGEVQQIARLVAKKCGGLPLGIVTMAGCMRGERSEHVWSDALRTLRDPRSSQHDTDMEDYVFKILRFSYDRLNDEKLQKCFLYCALYPEDEIIRKDELISQFIAEGLLDGSRRQEKIDRGHTLLNALENASLLECVADWQDRRCVKMHDLVRDMAIKIIGSTGLVKGGNSLKEVPAGELQCINEKLQWLSLMKNDIEQIGEVPNCPNVSVVLLQNNYLLKFISESFFVHMIGLNILNLSRTKIEKLPESVSDLANLKVLLLSECSSLNYIPPIGKLTKLRELVLQGCCKLMQFPEGIEEMVSLEVLNVCSTAIKGTLSVLILGKLESFESNCKIVVQEPNELLSLIHLTKLCKVLFSYADWVNHCIDLSGLEQLKTYSVCVGSDGDELIKVEGSKGICIQSCGLEIGTEVSLQVPDNVEFLRFYKCRFGGKSLLDNVPSLYIATKLRDFEIETCKGIKYIISEDGGSKALEEIQHLQLKELDDLVGLVRVEEVHPYISFASLSRLEIIRCEKLKKLCPENIDLPNLEVIDVQSCEQMEELFATEIGATMELPRLRTVRLENLPELKSICRKTVVCNSLELVEVDHLSSCKLENFPISIPRLSTSDSNGENHCPIIPRFVGQNMDRARWLALSWNDNNTKTIISQRGSFS